jgi:large subunit ribosomal protein L35
VRFAPQSPVIAAKFANLNWLCHNPRARRPADQGLPWRRPSAHQHDPEKWIPVFGKDHAEMQNKRAHITRNNACDRVCGRRCWSRRRLQSGEQMPKMKTKSGAKKRFKVTGSGKVLYQQSRKRHGMIKRTKKQIRQLRGTNVVFKTDGEKIKKYFLPNG